jgi:hypothetical protein
MSRYLIDRIAASPNIAVLCDTEIVELLGTPDHGLRGVRWRNRRTGAEEQHALAHLFLFTGADPAASWLTGCGMPLDEKGFVRTGADVGLTERLSLETGLEGIFAVGDVRCGSVKRVGAAIGEGAGSWRNSTPASPGELRRRPSRRPRSRREAQAEFQLRSDAGSRPETSEVILAQLPGDVEGKKYV